MQANYWAACATNPSSNQPLLHHLHHHCRCPQVVSRLETPDHWVTYAHVTSGEVINSDVRTAVHRRKVGNYY